MPACWVWEMSSWMINGHSLSSVNLPPRAGCPFLCTSLPRQGLVGFHVVPAPSAIHLCTSESNSNSSPYTWLPYGLCASVDSWIVSKNCVSSSPKRLIFKIRKTILNFTLIPLSGDQTDAHDVQQPRVHWLKFTLNRLSNGHSLSVSLPISETVSPSHTCMKWVMISPSPSTLPASARVGQPVRTASWPQAWPQTSVSVKSLGRVYNHMWVFLLSHTQGILPLKLWHTISRSVFVNFTMVRARSDFYETDTLPTALRGPLQFNF